MKLLIVESPSKAKTIGKYLGKDYEVMSSVGHIVDLPKSKLGIDIDSNFSLQYTIIPGKEKVIKQITEASKKVDEIILATDPDREGEAIAWHLQNQIQSNFKKGSMPKIKRIVFHEITKNAILDAIKKNSKVNLNLVDAQQARRVLDRLVGYTLSPLIWKKIRYGLSAGRVQSVALKLIVDRERERRAFIPQEYWSLDMIASLKENDVVNKSPKIIKMLKDSEAKLPTFEKEIEQGFLHLTLMKYNSKNIDIKSEVEYDHICSELNKSDLIIEEISKKNLTKRPYPPFTTSSFQQASINVLNMTSRNAMRAAQKLYEAGLITYMRTDSLYLSNTAITSIREVVNARFGAKYLPDKPVFYKNNSKNAQEAHEAIRPTDFTKVILPKSFSQKEIDVYNLIYNRALSSQMAPSIYEDISLKVIDKTDKSKFLFKASARKLIFDGWQMLYGVKQKTNLIKQLESLKSNMPIYPMTNYGVQHFTEPKPRYSEASLIKEMEKNGIGRPSTYANIMSVISERNYVVKEGKFFAPTETGEVVIKLLEENFENIVDVGFTSNMEASLDEIANNGVAWIPIVKEFWDPFIKTVDEKDKSLKKDDFVNLGLTEELCDLCGKPMMKKIGRFGVFLSCTGYPECKGIKNFSNGEKKEEVDISSEEFKSTYKPAPMTEDGREFLFKSGRFGNFWAHPDYPKVKDARPLEYTDEALFKLYGEPPKTSTGETMVLRSGRFGKFWAHPEYPKVKEFQKIKKSKS